MADQKRDARSAFDDDDDDDYILAAEQAEEVARQTEFQPQQTAYGIAASHVNPSSSIMGPSFEAWGGHGEMHGSGC